MIILSKFYIYLYFFYSYFGYNFIYRYLSNKKIDCALLDSRAYAFIGKRLCMLSHLTFLYSAFFIEYPSLNRYLNTIFLHTVTNGGYYCKWGLSEYSTFFMHVFWSIPVTIYGSNYLIIISNDYSNLYINYENYGLLLALLGYLKIHNKIYTSRVKYIDEM